MNATDRRFHRVGSRNSDSGAELMTQRARTVAKPADRQLTPAHCWPGTSASPHGSRINPRPQDAHR